MGRKFASQIWAKIRQIWANYSPNLGELFAKSGRKIRQIWSPWSKPRQRVPKVDPFEAKKVGSNV
jgi:hypothetical protein